MIIQYGSTVLVFYSLIQIHKSIQTKPEESPQYVRPSKQNDVTMCPYISAWKERARELCNDGDLSFTKYHCLEKQTGGYMELCMDPVIVNEGEYPKVTFAEVADYVRIYFEKCPRGFYQSLEGLSNDINKCRMKSKCSKAVGQLSSGCSDGGTTRDQQCRCDFQRGYIANIYALTNPLKKSCFTPSIQNSACSMDNTCSGDRELDRAYRCVRKCPKNWHRPPEDLECKQSVIYDTSTMSKLITTTTQASLQFTSKETTITTTASSMMKDSDDNVIIATVVTSSFTGISLLLVLVTCYLLRKRMRTHNNKDREAGGIELEEHNGTDDNGDNRPCTININAERVTYNITNIGTVGNLIQGDGAAVTVSNGDNA